MRRLCGGGVRVEPEADRLGDALVEGDAALLAVVLELPVQPGGEIGGERTAACGVHGGAFGVICTPCLDAFGHGVLDADAELGCPDLEFLSQGGGQLGDYLFPVIGGVWDGHAVTLLTSLGVVAQAGLEICGVSPR